MKKLLNICLIFIKLILNRPNEVVPDNKLATKTRTGRN